jgi:hypothetical protein
MIDCISQAGSSPNSTAKATKNDPNSNSDSSTVTAVSTMISDAVIRDRLGGFAAVVMGVDQIGEIYDDGRVVGRGTEMMIMRSGIMETEGEVEDVAESVMNGKGEMRIIIRCSLMMGCGCDERCSLGGTRSRRREMATEW